MGIKKPDECIFCGRELEDWYYECFEENGERAENSKDKFRTLDICKGCVIKLKEILE